MASTFANRSGVLHILIYYGGTHYRHRHHQMECICDGSHEHLWAHNVSTKFHRMFFVVLIFTHYQSHHHVFTNLFQGSFRQDFFKSAIFCMRSMYFFVLLVLIFAVKLRQFYEVILVQFIGSVLAAAIVIRKLAQDHYSHNGNRQENRAELQETALNVTTTRLSNRSEIPTHGTSSIQCTHSHLLSALR